jgi:AhpD family alkylhydroperoxidase
MQARIKTPILALPGTLEAFHTLAHSAEKCDLSRSLLELVNLRCSQINGCSVCVDMHSRALRKLGEKDAKIFSVGAWREAPYYSDAERAALALAEAGTRLADKGDAIPDELWNEASRHYSETQLGGLTMAISSINFVNRLNALTRQVSGDWVEQYI